MRNASSQITATFRSLRQPLRMLRRRPLLALVAIATLAIGIGASTGVFSLANAVLLRPLPYLDPERLIDIREVAPTGERPVSYPDYADWRSDARAFTDLAAYQSGSTALLADSAGSLSTVGIVVTSANLFTLLGVRPELGRGFVAADENLSSERAVILSHGLWTRRFGGDATVVGKTILLDGVPRRVLGVLPASFRFYDGGADAWLALRMPQEFRERRNLYWLRVVGRLRPGATLEGARAEMDSVAARLEAAYPESNRAARVSLRDRWIGDARPTLRALMFAVTGVFLIACVNVAGLLIARVVSRRGDIVVHMALGAGRLEVVGQALFESSALAVLGGIGGFAVAKLSVNLAVGAIPVALRSPYLADSGLDLAAAGFAVGATFRRGATLRCGFRAGLASATGARPPALRGPGQRGQPWTAAVASRTRRTAIGARGRRALVRRALGAKHSSVAQRRCRVLSRRGARPAGGAAAAATEHSGVPRRLRARRPRSG